MGHKLRNPVGLVRGLPRMSWHPKNLFNLYMRTYGPLNADTRFQKTFLTMFQQKWKAKKLARAYHGDWIPETKFKRHFLPDELPPIVGKPGEEKVPLASLMFAEIEKRLDTVVFRSCLAQSVYGARHLVMTGKVRLNGKKFKDPNYRMQPGDLISVDPQYVVTLRQGSPWKPESLRADETEDLAEADPAAEPAVDASPESSADASTPDASHLTSAPANTAKTAKPLKFNLPDYAAPFLFVPPYLEVSWTTCSVVYLRHPTARPGVSEIPTPYDADGEVMRLTWEYYLGLGRKGDKRPAAQYGRRLGA
ncbi:nam9 protein, mitochondrial precursor [Rhodotorula toruloides]|uniref:Nam9 protein, mitochondrial n=1 Tax=Rhodotorula toruloides TaxID=5286 RepID=A0A511KIP2_RHOTO|nr:nam9 protein, mitochondrial precursor [Rhodotorula toruloides]